MTTFTAEDICDIVRGSINVECGHYMTYGKYHVEIQFSNVQDAVMAYQGICHVSGIQVTMCRDEDRTFHKVRALIPSAKEEHRRCQHVYSVSPRMNLQCILMITDKPCRHHFARGGRVYYGKYAGELNVIHNRCIVASDGLRCIHIADHGGIHSFLPD